MEQTTAETNTIQQGIDSIEKIVNTVIEFLVNYSFQVVGALIVLFIGFMAAKWIGNILLKSFEKKGIDITLSKFLVGIIRAVVIGFAIIIALGKFGITIAPFIAALGAIAFGVSLAIQGPVANYGAGVVIILTRPFVVGDTVTIAGQSGVVDIVTLANTQLVDEEGVRITIPNKLIVGEIIENSKANKLADGVIGISYEDEPELAIAAIKKVLAGFEEICRDPEPAVGVSEFADSSVNISYRYWVPTTKFFKTSYNVNLAVYKAIQDAKLTIPFPQRDVHVVSQQPLATS